MVHVGYFRNFIVSRNVLLIAGDEDALTSLAQALRQLAAGRTQELSFRSFPFCDLHFPERFDLWAVGVNTYDCGLEVRPCRVAWKRSAESWLDAAETVAVLARRRPNSEELDNNGNSVVMIASGNFSEPWWEAMGLLGPNRRAGQFPNGEELRRVPCHQK